MRPLDAPLAFTLRAFLFRFTSPESHMTLLAIVWLASFAVLVEAFAEAPVIDHPDW